MRLRRTEPLVTRAHARELRTTSKVSCERFRSSVIVL